MKGEGAKWPARIAGWGLLLLALPLALFAKGAFAQTRFRLGD